MSGYTPRLTLIALAVSSALVACSASNEHSTPAAANTATTQTPAPARNESPAAVRNQQQVALVSETDSLEEIVVTGAKIERRDYQANSPLIATTADASRIHFAPAYPAQVTDTERYATLEDNLIKQVASEPVSTFSIDVDTGAYSNVRRFLTNGQLPPADAVRTEELINYFDYDYGVATGDVPFGISTEIAPSPWHAGRHLLHIGIQAVDPDATEQLQRNLVFLVDVSGSMQGPDKIDLLKTSLKLLTRQLDEEDRISIVVYAGASGVVLEPTAGSDTATISAALERLQAGGSTNGAAGIELAYSLAQQNFIKGGINRVLLATDGDFNVGLTDFDGLKRLIEQKRKSGISLTTLGFGTGNYNDQLMEQLADAGNGNYAYIDNINEARKVLVDELGSTLHTVAKDVKIQLEFNPAVVSEYRLVGYENRVLAREDFNNDKVDAGEIGAGHTVTALYEISLVGSNGQSSDPLRYTNGTSVADGSPTTISANELGYLKLRYKQPDGDTSQLLQQALLVEDIREDVSNTSDIYRFSAAVAGFSQLLRDNKGLATSFDYDAVLALATAAKGDDENGYRSEFINLVKTAQVLTQH